MLKQTSSSWISLSMPMYLPNLFIPNQPLTFILNQYSIPRTQILQARSTQRKMRLFFLLFPTDIRQEFRRMIHIKQHQNREHQRSLKHIEIPFVDREISIEAGCEFYHSVYRTSLDIYLLVLKPWRTQVNRRRRTKISPLAILIAISNFFHCRSGHELSNFFETK